MAGRHKIFGILLIALVLFGCSANKTAVDKDKAHFHYQLALSAISSKDYTASLGELLKAREYDPKNAEINHTLGLSYYAKGRVREAITSYKAAIKIKPDFSQAWNNLGVVYLATKSYNKARHAFEKALDNLLYARPENAYLNLGLLEMELGRFEAAVRYFTRAKQAAPRYCAAYYFSAKALEKKKKLNPAIENIKLAIKFCPDFAEAYRFGGILWLHKKKRSTAISYFERASTLSPDGDVGQEARRYLKVLKKRKKRH